MYSLTSTVNFNPPTSCEVGPGLFFFVKSLSIYFNPPTSCEVGQNQVEMEASRRLFQSTHLLRGGTFSAPNSILLWPLFQSTHLLRGGTFNKLISVFDFKFQSTHLLRGGTVSIMSA